MGPWYASRYTGLFTRCGPVPTRPHDPAVCVWSGALAPWGPRADTWEVGGADWDRQAAEAAGVGEAIERCQPYPLLQDHAVTARYDSWPLDEPAVAPERWILFHAEQYAQPGFPFTPLTGASVCRWVCFRRAGTGEPWWVPEDLAYLSPRPGESHRFTAAVSTGLACGRPGQPVLLRGLQEVIERDAVLGAWWGRYPLEEWDPDVVFAAIGPEVGPRVRRQNLRYRCFRAATPFSAHAVIVTVEGEDRAGFCFSAGSACRETRPAAWEKALLEAIHGRHYVRHLRERGEATWAGLPRSFAEHALYYSLHPEELSVTAFHRACPTGEHGRDGRGTPCSHCGIRVPRPSRSCQNPSQTDSESESWAALCERLGPERPVLFRDLTPPGVARARLGWCVLRVLVPGLQPLHGHHALPHLGGPLWAPRGLADWAAVPPHPFP